MRNVSSSLPILVALSITFSACADKAKEAITDAANAAAASAPAPAAGASGSSGIAGSAPRPTQGKPGAAQTNPGANGGAPAQAAPGSAFGARPQGGSYATARMLPGGGASGVTVTVTQGDGREEARAAEARRAAIEAEFALVTTNPDFDEVAFVVPKNCSAELKTVKLRIRKNSWRSIGSNHFSAEVLGGQQTIDLPYGEARVTGAIEFKDLPVALREDAKIRRLFKANLAAHPFQLGPSLNGSNSEGRLVLPLLRSRGGSIELTSPEGSLYSWSSRYRLDLEEVSGFPFHFGRTNDREGYFSGLTQLKIRGEFAGFSSCSAQRNRDSLIPTIFATSRLTTKVTLNDDDQLINLYGLVYKIRGGTTLDLATIGTGANRAPELVCPRQIETTPVSADEARDNVLTLPAGVYSMMDQNSGLRCWPNLPMRFERPVTIASQRTMNREANTFTEISGLEYRDSTSTVVIGGTRVSPYIVSREDNFFSPVRVSSRFYGWEANYARATTYRLETPQAWAIPYGILEMESEGQNGRPVKRTFAGTQQPVQTQIHELFLTHDTWGVTTIVEYRQNLRWRNLDNRTGMVSSTQPYRNWSAILNPQEAAQRRYCLVTLATRGSMPGAYVINYGLTGFMGERTSPASGETINENPAQLARRYCASNPQALLQVFQREYPGAFGPQ